MKAYKYKNLKFTLRVKKLSLKIKKHYFPKMISKKYYSLVLAAILNIQIIGCISDFNTDTGLYSEHLLPKNSQLK